jgi:oxalate decarboxylase/phosphoglucose isomerase-like protein (cupin superfamily)
MQFTPAIAATILAFAAGVIAVPAGMPSAAKRQTAAPAGVTLTLTQQLFLADNAEDRFNLLKKDTDFVFNFAEKFEQGKTPDLSKTGGLATANRKTFPALVTSGGSMALSRVNKCSMNTLHVHPRGAEIQYVTKGTLKTQMIPENAVKGPDGKPRVITNTVSAGSAQVFYQGSVHTQANLGCETAEFVAFFTTEEAGAGSIAQEFFAADGDIVEGTLGPNGLSATDVPSVRDKIPASFAAELLKCVEECKKQGKY